MREEIDALQSERTEKIAKLAYEARQRQEAEHRRLEIQIYKMRSSVTEYAKRIWRKAQNEHPDDFDTALATARRNLRREVNARQNSRVWPEKITQEFERIITETFTPAPTLEKIDKPQPQAPSIPQPDPTSQPALRRKSGPSGPKF